jgi:hypothetical protein
MYRICFAVLACACLLTSKALAQTQPSVPEGNKGLGRGPLLISSLTGGSYSEDPDIDDEQGVEFRKFSLSATNGLFTLRASASAVILQGVISNLKIEGKKSLVQGTNKPELTIKKGDLVCDVQLNRDLTFVAYGGTLIVQRGKTVQVTNALPIHIRGASYLGQAGSLRITAPDARWKSAKFEFPYLTDPVVLNLGSRADSPVLIDVPLDTLRPIASDAVLDSQIGSSYSRKSFDLASDTYKSRISGLSVDTFSVHLLRDHLDLTIQGLACAGEFVGKITGDIPIPVVSSGHVKLSSLTATAPLSIEAANLQAVQLRGVKLQAPPVRSALAADSQLLADTIKTEHSAGTDRTNDTLLRIAFTEGNSSSHSEASSSLSPGNEPTEASPINLSSTQAQFLVELDLSSPAAQQHDAIAAARKQLATFGSPNFVMHIPSGDLEQLVTRGMESIGIPNSAIQFRSQQILLSVQPKQSFLGLNALKIVLAIAPNVEGPNIVIRYALSVVAVTSLNVTTSVLLEKIIDQVRADTSGIQVAVTNPNSTVVLPLPTKFLQPVDFNQSLPPDPKTGTQVTIASVPTNVTFKIAGADLLIDSKGLHILAVVVVE